MCETNYTIWEIYFDGVVLKPKSVRWHPVDASHKPCAIIFVPEFVHDAYFSGVVPDRDGRQPVKKNVAGKWNLNNVSYAIRALFHGELHLNYN